MGDASNERRLESASESIAELTRTTEYWYLVAKSAVGVVVRTAGTDAAEALLATVQEEAMGDFPLHAGESRVSEQAASYLLDNLRQLARVWEKHGSLIGRV